MKPLLIAASILTIGAGLALAQDSHHEAGSPEQQSPSNGTPSPMQMMENMPEQCRAMMQGMPETCMSAMQEMMRGRMGGSMMQEGMAPGMMRGNSESEAAAPIEQKSEARQAYEEALEKMHAPMIEGVAEEDPDVAFVRGMIPHHQGAIDMAKVVQQHGDDQQTKDWAARIIEAQKGEIAEMQKWLEKNAN